jgi:DNA-binding response OmpR family regulator
MKVLIYSGNEKSGKPLCRIMEQCGMRAELALDQERCLYLAMTDRYAAIIMRGLSMAEVSDFYQKWKQAGGTGFIVVLADSNSGVQRARLLELGIDRCLIEPCSFTRLATEILQHEYHFQESEEHRHVTAHFEIDFLRRSATFAGELLRLTRTEFELLALLVRRRGVVLSRLQIWEEIRGYDEYPVGNTVDVHMNRLRRKLPGKGAGFIDTIYGIGYRLHADA